MVAHIYGLVNYETTKEFPIINDIKWIFYLKFHVVSVSLIFWGGEDKIVLKLFV
jgi:hypothetical protein